MGDPGDLDEAKFKRIFAAAFEQNLKEESYLRCLVVEHVDSRRVVATTTLLWEQKLLRGGKKVGHIEDVITHPDFQRKGLSKMILTQLVAEAKQAGECYKLILDCTEPNSKVYAKCGFFATGEIQMRLNV